MASASLLLPLGCIFGRTNSSNHQRTHKSSVAALSSESRLQASSIVSHQDECVVVMNRRNMINVGVGLLGLMNGSTFAEAAGLPQRRSLSYVMMHVRKSLKMYGTYVTTESGLQYKDIKVGGGPSPRVGFQVAASYVAMVPSGQIFDSSLEKGQLYIFRVGAGQVIKGLDEGILSMKAGGKRRIYVPGPLAFPKGLNSAPGRPRVAPNSPVVFDVSLEYIPGLEDEE